MYKPTLLLAAFAALTSAAAVPGPAPTSAPRLVKRGEEHISSICEASTKTLFGPYTLKYPIAGLDQSDVFYAIELPDGTIELSVHGSHDLPLSGHDEDGIIVDFPGGKGGKVGGEVQATEVIGGKTYTLSFGGGGGWGTVCPTATKKISPGQAGFPTAKPVWPRKVFGYELKPGAVAENAAVQTKA